MFPSSKKKRLCKLNGPGLTDSGVFASIDSTPGELNDREETLSPMIMLDKLEGTVSIMSEATV